MNMESEIKGVINNTGTHTKCGKKQIEYGILNGSFWYWCHSCNRAIDKKEVTSELIISKAV